MRILSIGDVHGRDAWQRLLFPGSSFSEWKSKGLQGAIREEDFPMVYGHDRIVFTGDYVDSHHDGYSDSMILINLLNIIELKQLLGDRVELLVGNHDTQYIVIGDTFTGYRPTMKRDLKLTFDGYSELFNVAYQLDGPTKFLFTHAGVTESYRRSFMAGVPVERFAEKLNEQWRAKADCIFLVSWSRGGISPVPGPVWSDRSDMLEDPIDGITQVVGHTPVQLIHSFEKHIIFTDCQRELGSEQFLFIDTEAGFDGLKVLTPDPNNANPLRFKLEPSLKFDSIENHAKLMAKCLSSQR